MTTYHFSPEHWFIPLAVGSALVITGFIIRYLRKNGYIGNK